MWRTQSADRVIGPDRVRFDPRRAGLHDWAMRRCCPVPERIEHDNPDHVVARFDWSADRGADWGRTWARAHGRTRRLVPDHRAGLYYDGTVERVTDFAEKPVHVITYMSTSGVVQRCSLQLAVGRITAVN